MRHKALLLALALTAPAAAANTVPTAIAFEDLARRCAPQVHPATMKALVSVESSYNPYAIGVVGGRLARQPRELGEAIATAQSLEAQGWNFSLGLGQVNRHNLAKYGLRYRSIFDPCENLHAGAAILANCFARAQTRSRSDQAALRAALSCYYSGNFTTGFAHGYVQKVVASADAPAQAIPVVPAIERGAGEGGEAPVAKARKRAATPGARAGGEAWVTFGEPSRARAVAGARADEQGPGRGDGAFQVKRADPPGPGQQEAGRRAPEQGDAPAPAAVAPASQGEPFLVIVE